MIRESDRVQLADSVSVSPAEIEFQAIRAQGPGGQNVNKVSSAIQLRFDVVHSSLPDALKQRMLARQDRRLNREGVLVIKAQRHRSLEKNRTEALQRLCDIVGEACDRSPVRVATRPTRASRRRRLERKARRGQVKSLRGPVLLE
jgi:ribosome-associated protein